jgi:hypothetical protein
MLNSYGLPLIHLFSTTTNILSLRDKEKLKTLKNLQSKSLRRGGGQGV